ncbi:MAG: AmmeMemoRadiSam system protein B [Candidatus Hydrogenedentota bacterium]|nr:MAG: AmmeMemoRadiSam system protein B [Candidatus Hydrogenedentota bacterium]
MTPFFAYNFSGVVGKGVKPVINVSGRRCGLILAILLLAACGASSISPKSGEIFEARGGGRWFPAERDELRRMVDRFLSESPAVAVDSTPRVLIVPHAGYVYSGPVAGAGFRAVQGRKYDAVIVLGFTHRYAFPGVAVFDRKGYRTPLGTSRIATKLGRRILDAVPSSRAFLTPFDGEHSAENELPFVQRALSGTPVLPLLMGRLSGTPWRLFVRELGRILAEENVLLVVSTDLSHYHPLAVAEVMDTKTITAAAALDFDRLRELFSRGEGEACGAMPVLTAVAAMKEAGGFRGRIVRYGTSASAPDGDPKAVVGYAAIVFWKENDEKGSGKEATAMSEREPQSQPAEGRGGEAEKLTPEERRTLLRYAREVLEAKVQGLDEPAPPAATGHLAQHRGAFVTLKYNGRLRGCIGQFTPDQPLVKTIREMTIAAAFRDNRFRPVDRMELGGIEIEISVLTPPRKVSGPEEIVLGRDGIIVRQGFRSGTFLPQVATETGWSVEEFLSNCAAHKAGLPPDAWKHGAEILTYQAEVFSEGEL